MFILRVGPWLLLFCLCAQANELTNQLSRFQILRSRYAEARKQNRAEMESITAGAELAAACFNLADAVDSDQERAAIAEEGIRVSRRILQQKSTNAAAHYYLAMNLGQLARTRTIGALKLLPEMEHEFKRAIDLDPLIDFAGPHRSLGMLYRDAPGWPASIGNKTKAKEHLLKATELSPEFPDNWLNLIEACLSWGDKDKAADAWKSGREHLTAARTRFVGAEWSEAWPEWDKRLQQIKSKLKVKALESPKTKD